MGIKMFQSKLFSSLGMSFFSQGWNRDRHSPTHSLSTLGLATAALVTMGAVAQAQTAEIAVAQTNAEPVLPAAGRYLFGQSTQPDQVGQGYVVLERTGNQVYGALYFPSSSFDCFEGQVQGNTLAMTIVNSYDQEAYPYTMALADGPVVAANDPSGALVPFGLDGFHALSDLSENDHRMLAICQGVLAPAP